MSGFHRPDAFLEPVKQRQIVGRATEEGLTKMYVRLNETGKDRAASCVDHDVSTHAGLAKTSDASVANQQITANDGVALVHRQECSAFYENLHWVSAAGCRISGVACRKPREQAVKPTPNTRYLIPDRPSACKAINKRSAPGSNPEAERQVVFM